MGFRVEGLALGAYGLGFRVRKVYVSPLPSTLGPAPPIVTCVVYAS